MNRQNARAGFTLIEVVVVIAVIGILAAIAIPQFADSIRTSNEGSTKANLGSIRKALSVYYSDLDGQYPQALSALTQSARYLRRLPAVNLPQYHPNSSAVTAGSVSDDTGGWLYDATAGAATYGVLRVNCVHTDRKGSVWTAY